MNYVIYFSQANGPNTVIRKSGGTTTVAAIKHLEEITFKTSAVKLVTSKLDGGFYWADGSRSRKKDSLEGVALKIHHGGQLVYEWASSGVPKEPAPAERPATR